MWTEKNKTLFGSPDILERDHWIEHRSAIFDCDRGCDRIVKSDTVPIRVEKNWYYSRNERRNNRGSLLLFVSIAFPIKIIETPVFNFILKLNPANNIHDVNFKIAVKKVDPANNELLLPRWFDQRFV